MSTISCLQCSHVYDPQEFSEDHIQNGHTTWCPECDEEMEIEILAILTVVPVAYREDV